MRNLLDTEEIANNVLVNCWTTLLYLDMELEQDTVMRPIGR